MSHSNSSLATQGPVDIMVVLVVRYLIAQISEKTSILVLCSLFYQVLCLVSAKNSLSQPGFSW